MLSTLVKEPIVTATQKAESRALMCDESTDIGVLKRLVTYVRLCKDGQCQTHLLSMKDLPDGTAESITAALESLMADCDLSPDKLSSFGSDGANVTVGKQSGVATRLAELNSGLVGIYGIAHRLSLASAQAGNQVPYLRKVKDWLAAVWKNFHFSPVRAASLVEMHRVLNLDELKLVKAADSR